MVSRPLLAFALALLPVLGFACGEKDLQAARNPTPSTGTGPFYPGAEAFSGRHNDLTSNLAAEGTVIVFEGVVTDEKGAVGKAELHVWQADAIQGRYEHPRFPESVPRDPGFLYLGRATTDENGYYRFRTIVPPPYPAGPGWYRSRHVHVAVLVPDRPVLYTEMHFAGDASIGQDHFLLHAIPDLAPLLITFERKPYAWKPGESPSEVLLGRFDIVLGNAP